MDGLFVLYSSDVRLRQVEESSPPAPLLARRGEKRSVPWRGEGWLWSAFSGGGEQAPGAAQVFDGGEDGPDNGEQEDDVREGEQVIWRGGGGAASGKAEREG